MTDQSIVESIRSDANPRALSALYKHFPMIRSLIRRNGGTTKDDPPKAAPPSMSPILKQAKKL